MIKLLDEIDFSKELSQEPELQAYIKEAAKQIQKQQSEQLIKFKKPVFDEDLQSHVIVTNIPDLKGKDKEQKFLALFKNFLEKKGIGAKDGLQTIEPGFTLVNNEKVYNKTLYIIYKNSNVAKKAYQKLHHLKFDKDHTLACFTVKQFKDVQKIVKDYTPLQFIPKKQLIQSNIDENFRDQFIYSIRQNNKTKLTLKWFDHVQRKTQQAIIGQWQNVVAEGTKNVVFSSRGSYIAICQPKGIRILAGKNLQSKGFYAHQGVTQVIFSPNQTYMISYNKTPDNINETYIIWSVQSQINLKQYKAQLNQTLNSFQFNNDQTKLGIGLSNQFVVYTCDTVQNLKKQFRLSEDELLNQGKLFKALNLQKFVWLPDGVSVTCVCYELNPSINSHPTSKIFTYNTQTKQEKKWKAIGLNIKKAEITVSNNKDWVSVFFKKIQKKNLSTSVVYIVNLLKRDIQTEVIQFKQNVVSLSWDKQNGRFGAVYQIPSQVKNDDIKFGVSFYQIQVKDKLQQALKFGQIAMTPANRIILAQNGTFFALYNIEPFSWGKYKYSMGIFAKDQKSKKLAIQIIKKNIQIPYMTYFEMDASGRFILTGTDKTYQIWTTAGQIIHKDMFSTQIHNVHFRPRYLLRLPLQRQNKLQEREKQIKKKYEEEDQKRLHAIEYQMKKEKEDRKIQFSKYLQQKKIWFQQFKQKRDIIRGFSEDDPIVKSAIYEHSYLQRIAK